DGQNQLAPGLPCKPHSAVPNLGSNTRLRTHRHQCCADTDLYAGVPLVHCHPKTDVSTQIGGATPLLPELAGGPLPCSGHTPLLACQAAARYTPEPEPSAAQRSPHRRLGGKRLEQPTSSRRCR